MSGAELTSMNGAIGSATLPSRAGASGRSHGAGIRYWRHASTLVIIMIMVIAVRLHEFIPGVSVVRPAAVSAVGGLALILLNTSPGAVRKALAYRPFRWAVAYFIWAMLTVPTSLWPGLSVESLRALLPPVLVFFALLLCAPRRDVYERILFWFVVASAAFGVVAVTMGTISADRISAGATYDPNDMAAMMAMALFPAIGLAIRRKGLSRLIMLGAAAAIVAAVLGSGSRGGVLAVAAGAAVMILGFRGRRRALITLVVVVGSIVAWNASSPLFKERVISLLSLEEDYNVTTEGGRIEVWKRGIGYTADHAILGVGIGNFATAEGAWRDDIRRAGKWSAAHNAYIQAFAELGIPGGLIFLGLLGSLFKKAYARWRERPRTRRRGAGHRPELLASLVSFMVAAVFLSLAYFYVLFALAGLIAIADRALPEPRRMAAARPPGVR